MYQCLHKSGFPKHVSSYVGEHSGRLFDGSPVHQFRRIRERPVESVHVLAPVLKVVHVDVVFAHVMVVVDVRRMTSRMIANHLSTQQPLNVNNTRYLVLQSSDQSISLVYFRQKSIDKHKDHHRINHHYKHHEIQKCIAAPCEKYEEKVAKFPS